MITRIHVVGGRCVNAIRLRAIFAAALVAAAASPASAIVSTFDADVEGWTITNATAMHVPAGGNPGGYLFFDNPETTISNIVAPAKFLGDLRAFDGGMFSFDGNLLQQIAPDFAAYGTVSLSGPSDSVSLDIVPDQPPVGVWVHYSVDLTAATWGRSQMAWEDLLSNVTSLQITIEAVFGGEMNGVDNIAITPEPAAACLLAGGAMLIGRRRRRR